MVAYDFSSPLHVRVKQQPCKGPHPGWALSVCPVENPELSYMWDDLHLEATPEAVVHGRMRTWMLDGQFLTFDRDLKFSFSIQEAERVYVPLIVHGSEPYAPDLVEKT